MRFNLSGTDIIAPPFQLSLKIEKLWGEDNGIEWHLYEDVNILTGINGSGKSTLLRLLYCAYCNDFSEFFGTEVFERLTIQYYGVTETYTKSSLDKLKKLEEEEWDFSASNNSLEAMFYDDTKMIYINTFDVLLQDTNLKSERVKTSLDSLLYKKGKEYGIYLKKLEKRVQVEGADEKQIYQAKNRFLEILNQSFEATRKHVREESKNGGFFFEKTSIGKRLSPFLFSSGEKQFFYILLVTVKFWCKNKYLCGITN